MTWIEKALSKPVSKEELRCSMSLDEVEFLYRLVKGEPFRFSYAAFRCGFEKGRRCERAAQKRTKKQPTPPPTKVKR